VIRKIVPFTLGIAALLSVLAADEIVKTASDQARIDINADAPTRVYDRMIFGGFLEHIDNQIYGGVFEPGSPLADQAGFRTDVLEAIMELKVPVVRWPGGCFVDSYHWQKGVGEKREAYGDFRWGAIEPNNFGTHEFVDLCRRIKAEPYICLNGLASTQESLDWVAYCNATEGEFAEMRKANGHPDPFNVKFWSVGNERYDKVTVDRVRDVSMELRRLYPNLKLTCPGAQDGMKGVPEYLINQVGGHLDYVSIHSYALSREIELPRYDYLTAIAQSEQPEALIESVISSIRAVDPRGGMKLAYDEWNLRAWQHPGFPRDRVDDYDAPEVRELVARRRMQNDQPDQYTMADALFTASFLNACLRRCDVVTMANIAPLVNTRGPIFAHPKGIVKRTHYHTMWMYANLLQERVADVTVSAVDIKGTPVSTIDAVATVDATGSQWSVAFINRHASASVACTLVIDGASLDGTYKATILTGDSAESYNDIEHPHRVTPKDATLTFRKGAVSLPAHSLVIVDVVL